MPTMEMHQEFDVYVGLTKDFGSMSLDIGAVHYDYPGNSSNKY